MNEQSKLDFLVDFSNRQLTQYIMPFWRTKAVDNEKGGFYAHINHDMSVAKDEVKGLVLNARILWTFSTVYKAFQN